MVGHCEQRRMHASSQTFLCGLDRSAHRTNRANRAVRSIETCRFTWFAQGRRQLYEDFGSPVCAPHEDHQIPPICTQLASMSSSHSPSNRDRRSDGNELGSEKGFGFIEHDGGGRRSPATAGTPTRVDESQAARVQTPPRGREGDMIAAISSMLRNRPSPQTRGDLRGEDRPLINPGPSPQARRRRDGPPDVRGVQGTIPAGAGATSAGPGAGCGQ